jgi:hypothetical protein
MGQHAFAHSHLQYDIADGPVRPAEARGEQRFAIHGTMRISALRIFA